VCASEPLRLGAHCRRTLEIRAGSGKRLGHEI
jgi:hypothetical protein